MLHFFPVLEKKQEARTDPFETPLIGITLTTDFPAFFVQADIENVRGEFNDNSITLLPGRPRMITFTPKEGPAKKLPTPSVMHLAKSY